MGVNQKDDGKIIDRIRELARQGKVEPADQTKTHILQNDIVLLLQVMGYDPRWCLVTDLSIMDDFCDNAEDLLAISETLELDLIDSQEYLWEVAERMKAQEES